MTGLSNSGQPIIENFTFREVSVQKAEEMFAHLDEDGNGDLTEVMFVYQISF